MCNLSIYIYMAFKASTTPAGYNVLFLKWAWSLTVDHASYMLSAELHNNHNHIVNVIGVYYKAKVQLLLQLQSRF